MHLEQPVSSSYKGMLDRILGSKKSRCDMQNKSSKFVVTHGKYVQCVSM